MKDDLAPAIRYAREGFPLTELIAFYWNLSVPRLSKYPGFTEQFTINGHAPAKGRDLEESQPRQHAGDDRERRSRRVLQGQDRARDRRLHEGQRRLSCRTRIWPRTRANGSSRSRRTIAATTSGSCRRTARASRRCRCSTSSKATTLERIRLRQPRTRASVRRGQEARVRGSRALLRRSGFLQGAGRVAALEGLRRRAPQADLDGPRAALGRSRSSASSKAATRSI